MKEKNREKIEDILQWILSKLAFLMIIGSIISIGFLAVKELPPDELIVNDLIRFNKLLIYFTIAIEVEIVVIAVIASKLAASSAMVGKDEILRDPDNLIEPYLLESLFDHKTDPNDFISTCIVYLVYKGNIKNIDNDKITLNSIEGISDIEKNMLDILFSNKELDKSGLEKYVGKTVSITSINDRINNELYYSDFFYHRFRYIQKLIKAQLIQDGIISDKWNKALGIIKTISKYFVFLVLLLFVFIEGVIVKNDAYTNVMGMILMSYTFFAIVNTLSGIRIVGVNKTSPKSIFILKVIEIVIIAVFFQNPQNAKLPLILFIALIIAELLSMIILKLTDECIYTEKGKQELKKAKMFRIFLVQYSLISQRDIDGVVVYDKYLVYATAFGIPSNITRRINKYLIGVNEKFKRGRSFFEGIGKEEI